MADLLDMSEWLFYDPPAPEPFTNAKAPAWQVDGGDTGYVRYASRATFPTPVTFSVSFAWDDDLDPDGPDWLGLHFLLMQDENTNYVFSLRHDWTALWQHEDHSHGDADYDPLTARVSHGVRPNGYRHQLRLRFDTGRLTAALNGLHGSAFDVNLHQADTRFPQLSGGRVGLRLDRQRLRLFHLAAAHG